MVIVSKRGKLITLQKIQELNVTFIFCFQPPPRRPRGKIWIETAYIVYKLLTEDDLMMIQDSLDEMQQV